MSGITDPFLIFALTSLIWAPLALYVNRTQVRNGVRMARANVIAIATTLGVALIVYIIVIVLRWLA